VLRYSCGLIAIACFVACGAGGVRPTFTAFPQAITDTIDGEPEDIVEHLSELLTEEGIESRWVRVREGYVETKWFDPVTRRMRGGRNLNADGIVRIRFWTDLVMEHQSVVVGEVVRRRVIDPSLPERETEVHVPPEHAGYEILQMILEHLASGTHTHEH